jgi:hypothetical protein
MAPRIDFGNKAGNPLREEDIANSPWAISKRRQVSFTSMELFEL